MCNSVAKRFDDPPALYAILNTLRDRYQITQLQTFVCGGVAARFKDPPALYAILDKLVDRYKVNLEQLMCNSLAARFDEPQALFAALDRLQECMGKGGLMLCRSTSFASRLFKPPEFVDTVLDIAVHLHTLGVDPGRALLTIVNNASARLYAKIGEFAAKVKECTDTESLTSVLRTAGRRDAASLAMIETW